MRRELPQSIDMARYAKRTCRGSPASGNCG